MSDREESVCMEVQIRTIAMDCWASLEHKIFYKFNEGNQAVPARLLEELKQAAASAAALDSQMERLHAEIGVIKEEQAEHGRGALNQIMISNQQFALPKALLALMSEEDVEVEIKLIRMMYCVISCYNRRIGMRRVREHAII